MSADRESPLRRRLVLLVFLIPFLGCGRAPKTFDEISVRRPVPAATARPVQLDFALIARSVDIRHWNETIWWNAAAEPERGEHRTSSSSSNRTGSAPCGGDLPPCWRIIGIESGGRWDAYNPTGCDGHGCYGPYQFSGAWAGKLGLPMDLSTTTHDQWIAAARSLWASGSGCGNWSAC